MGYSPRGCEELDTTEQLNHHHHLLTKSSQEGGEVRPAVSLGPLLVCLSPCLFFCLSCLLIRGLVLSWGPCSHALGTSHRPPWTPAPNIITCALGLSHMNLGEGTNIQTTVS